MEGKRGEVERGTHRGMMISTSPSCRARGSTSSKSALKVRSRFGM